MLVYADVYGDRLFEQTEAVGMREFSIFMQEHRDLVEEFLGRGAKLIAL